MRRGLWQVAMGVGLLVVATGHAHADALDVEYGAALRQTSLLLKWPTEGPILPEGTFGLTEWRLRPYVTVRPLENFSFSAAVESRASQSSLNLATPSGPSSGSSLLGTPQPLRRFDLTWEHVAEQRTSLQSSVERLDVFYRLGPVDLDVGRQPVSFGTSRFVSVVDVIAPFAPGDLDASYKPGVDAFRVRTGFGVTGEVEIVGVAADPSRASALVGRVRDSLFGIDIEAIGGRFRERAFGGLAWEGDVKIVGIWGEAALFERKSEPWRSGWSRAAFSGVGGVERNLPGNVMVGAGFFFQNFGASNKAALLTVYGDEPFQQGWTFLGARQYGVLTAQYEVHPLVNASAAGLINLIDYSTLWQPRVAVSVGNNTDITAFGWIGTGPKPRADASGLDPGSEFGFTPDGAGIYARWYF